MTNQETVASRSDGDQPPDRLVDLEELRRLAEQATPGPWAWSGRGNGYIRADKQTVADMRYRNGAKDAPYIAAANPATILSLLDQIEELRELLARSRNLGGEASDRVAALEEGLRVMVAACEQDNLWQLEEALDKARSLLQSSAASRGHLLRRSQGDEE